MSTPVVMPQMGESIAEGTIVRWIKKVGDTVDRDEPLFEISTDKVDAEIPSPAAGVLMAIAVKEGETVAVNSVVATIGAAGEKCLTAPAGATRCQECQWVPTVPRCSRKALTRLEHLALPLQAAALARRRRTPHPSWHLRHLRHPLAPRHRRHLRHRRATRHKSSPLVRRIAKEHNVDIGQHPGLGHRRPRDQAGHPRLHRRRRRVHRLAVRSPCERTARSGSAAP